MLVKNYIDGQFLAAKSGQTIANINPTTGTSFGELPRSGAEDLVMAVEAAKKAFARWSRMDISERSHLLIKLGDLIEQNLDLLAEAESRDTGKPFLMARKIDIPRAAENFRFFGAAIRNFSTESHLQEGIAVNYTRRAPLGVVGCISPWNLPLYLFSWKIAPAIAMGNCVIGKPSELTPSTAFILCQLCDRAGIPRGVINVLHGYGEEIGEAIVQHPEIKAISFTGGTDTGRTINSNAARQFKKVSLELGGKNSILVFSDADLDQAASESVRAAFSNQGQICLCGSRILVQDDIYESFKLKFLKQLKDFYPMQNTLPTDNFGAVISESHLRRIESYVNIAKQDGAVILAGGSRMDRDGYFFKPTVIEGLSSVCKVNQEEIFGPVVTLIPFETEEEAITMANDTPYGLASSIWTSNISRAHNTAHAVRAGIVWVNCWMMRDLRTPFGGMKDSGVGREGGNEALRFFTEAQNVCIKI